MYKTHYPWCVTSSLESYIYILMHLPCVLYHTNYSVQAMFQYSSFKRNFFPNLYFLLNNVNYTIKIFYIHQLFKSRDSSVGITLGYGLDDRSSRVRFPAGTGNFCLLHRVQNGSEAHPASYPVGTRGSLPGDKAFGEWSWPLTSI
jgi:hypothetical protein